MGGFQGVERLQRFVLVGLVDFQVCPQNLPSVLRNVDLHQQGLQADRLRTLFVGNPEFPVAINDDHDQSRDPKRAAAGELFPQCLEQDGLEKHHEQGKPQNSEHIHTLRHDPRFMECHAQRVPAETREQPPAQPFQPGPHRAEAEGAAQTRADTVVSPRFPPSRRKRSEEPPENRQIQRQQHRAEP
jgi:hypothetical protein